ncbi:MAG: Rha family transcriptional regulator [Deltaproteobacteria bacterium]|nr:Rha family transcriptional regulator [Candidatus Desulfobacula maris]
MNTEIVKYYQGEERAGTFLISQGFERKHEVVIKLINKYRDRFMRLENNKQFSNRFIIEKVPAKKAGRPVEEFLLNERQTIFLGTLFRNSNDTILNFKEKLADEFVKLREQNAALKQHQATGTYHITRDMSKLIRHEATDIMQEFERYAQSQGSDSPEKYYMLFTKMVNGLLFIVDGKFKNLRALMTIPQLMTTATAESVVTKGISDGMKNKMFYKDIYKDVKSRVMAFAELTGQSKVIEDCLFLDSPSGLNK